MSKRERSLLITVIAVSATICVGVSQPSCFSFVAALSGAAEVPPVETMAHGQAVFRFVHLPEELPGRGMLPPMVPIGEEPAQLHYKLISGNIEGMTQAHIHCGAENVNGPVVVFLFGLDPAGVTVHGIQAEGVITEGDVIPVDSSAECPGGVADLHALIMKMMSGNTYVNVHTLDFPAGEIRGQIRLAGQ